MGDARIEVPRISDAARLLVRARLGLGSLLLVAVAADLLATRIDGRVVEDAQGVLHRERDNWRLWIAVAIGVWSCAGRWVAVPLLARGNLAMFGWESRDALSAVGVPLLVIGGAADVVTRPAASRHIATTAPGQLEIFDHANQMGFLELSKAYHAEIRAFVDGGAPGASGGRSVLLAAS